MLSCAAYLLLVRVWNALQLERENWIFWLHARSDHSPYLNISPQFFFKRKFLFDSFQTFQHNATQPSSKQIQYGASKARVASMQEIISFSGFK